MAKYSINDDRFSVVNLNLFSSHSYLLTWYEDWRASGRIVIQSRFEWRSFRPQVVSPPNQSRFAPDQSRFASKLILNQKVDALRSKRFGRSSHMSNEQTTWNVETSKRFGWLGMLLKRANTSADHLICRTSKRHEMLKRANASDDLVNEQTLRTMTWNVVETNDLLIYDISFRSLYSLLNPNIWLILYSLLNRNTERFNCS